MIEKFTKNQEGFFQAFPTLHFSKKPSWFDGQFKLYRRLKELPGSLLPWALGRWTDPERENEVLNNSPKNSFGEVLKAYLYSKNKS